MIAFYTATINLMTVKSKAAYNRKKKKKREKHPSNRLNINANKLANVRRDIIRKKRTPSIEVKSIRENIKNRLNINIEGLNANNPEETHAEGQIETSCNNPSEVHWQIEKD